jgi:hypothetical protein
MAHLEEIRAQEKETLKGKSVAIGIVIDSATEIASEDETRGAEHDIAIKVAWTRRRGSS